MKNIGFGIIGIGRQGLRLAEHIRKDVPNAKLVAVCRRSDIGHEYSKQHGLKFYSNHHDLLKDKEVSAVLITTPSNLHGVQALDALKAKKHVLIDKPIASTLKEGRKIQALAERENLLVAVNFPLRVNPLTNTLRSKLNNIGKLKNIHVLVSHGPIRSEWQNNLKLSNGGVILDIGSHYFDLISYVTGWNPDAVNNAYSEKLENENSGFLNLTYKDFSASIVLLRNQKSKKSIITFAGDKGFMFADYFERKVILSTHHEVNEIECPLSNEFEIILNNLVSAIQNKDIIIANAEAGILSLKTCLSIYSRISTKKPVIP